MAGDVEYLLCVAAPVGKCCKTCLTAALWAEPKNRERQTWLPWQTCAVYRAFQGRREGRHCEAAYPESAGSCRNLDFLQGGG